MRRFVAKLWRILTAPFHLLAFLFKPIIRWLSHIRKEITVLFTEEPEDEPLADTFAKTMENPAGLLEHLNALRKHLLRAVVGLAITTAVSFTFTRELIDLLARPIGGIASLRAIDVTESIGTFMRVALLSGFSLALPYIAFELWLFAAPGLSRRSRFIGLLAIPAVVLFFACGLAFAYFGMMPTALRYLLNFMDITTIPRPSTYIGFVTSLLFWIGLAFEFPLVIYVLASMNIVNVKALANQWRLAIVVIALMAAAITPTVDPINMTLVMGPLVVLFFLSIGLGYLAQRRYRSSDVKSS